MPNRFLERLRSGAAIVADGGMGALISAAVPRLRCPEEANLRAPESVISVHVGYIRAGAELIETNTFGANRHKLARLYLEDELRRINEAAVKIARDAREMAGREVFIAGSIGPLGAASTAGQAGGARPDDRGPFGAGWDVGEGEEERAAIFVEQAQLLEGRGVDLFMIETFFDLEELTTAITAVQSVSSLPIVALLTFDEDGETVAGVTAREAAERARELGVAAVGANHGSGPQGALAALEQMGGNGLPLAAMPNLGLANLAGGRIVFPHTSPDYFADFAAQAHALGAKVIGGCCGTTPAEIAAIKRALEERRTVSLPIFVRDVAPAARREEAPGETRLTQALRAGDFVQTIEINPPMSGSYAGLLELCAELHAGGVGFIDVTDNYTARARMNPMIASAAIEQAVPGVETIPHLTPRDMTVMGLESILLGAHAAGLRNILAITGDPPAVGDYPGSQGVYEVDSIGLCRIMQHLNRGESYAGKLLDAPTSFFYGVAVNPTADDLDLELRRFEQKLEAGAQFAITQSLFELSYLDEFERRLGGFPIPVLLGVFFVTSYPLALRLHNEIPGMVVPEHVQARFRDAGAAAPEVGLELARELVAQARGRVAGVEVIAPFKAPLRALEVLR